MSKKENYCYKNLSSTPTVLTEFNFGLLLTAPTSRFYNNFSPKCCELLSTLHDTWPNAIIQCDSK